MEKSFGTSYGDVIVRTAMFDVDGTNVEEGIEIISIDGTFDLLGIFGYHNIEELTDDDVERLIEDHN